MDGAFWGSFGAATAVASAIASVVSFAAAAWWRRLDSSTVAWLAADGVSSWVADRDVYSAELSPPGARTRLLNVGDGDAYRVRIHGDGCRAVLFTERDTSMGVLGDELSVVATLPSGDEVQLSVVCEPTWWDAAGVWIEWTRRPTWRRSSVRVQRFPLPEIAERPQLMSRGFDASKHMTTTTPLPEPAFPVLSVADRTPEPSTPRGLDRLGQLRHRDRRFYPLFRREGLLPSR